MALRADVTAPTLASNAQMSLADWFLLGLSAGPERPALRMHRRIWTYHELHAMALDVAHDIVTRRGGGPSAIGLVVNRSSVASYTGVLGGLYSGAAIVPLEASGPPSRAITAAVAARVGVLLVEPRCRDVGRVLSEQLQLPVIDLRTEAESSRSISDSASDLASMPSVAAGDTAYVMFTSGTTGNPKGVPISHSNISQFLSSMSTRYQLRPDDVVSQACDLTFDLAMLDLFVAWAAAASVAHVGRHAYGSLPETAERLGLTVWVSVPSVVNLVMQTGQLEPGSLPGLRLSLFCGEPLRVRQVEQWLAAAPSSVIDNLYGPTEATVACTAYRWDAATSPPRCVNAIVPLGAPMPGVRTAIVDDRSEDAEEGELLVAGPQVFRGYLDSRDDGALVDRDGTAWYRTGDRVRRVSGPERMAFLGRLDDQLQIRGRRVEAAEIELALCAIDGVDNAVALTYRDRGHESLGAFYTGSRESPKGVITALSRIVPEYMLPRRVWRLSAFPLNKNGKIDRVSLRSRANDSVRQD